MSSMSDGLEEWFLRTLDQAGRANVLCIQNREAAAVLLEMHKVLSSGEARGGGGVMFSFKGVAQYRDTNAYGQWSSIAGGSPAQCTLVLTTAPASLGLLSRRRRGLDSKHPFSATHPTVCSMFWLGACRLRSSGGCTQPCRRNACAVKTAEEVPWPRPRFPRLCPIDFSSLIARMQARAKGIIPSPSARRPLTWSSTTSRIT
jgi:hypothetical protein